MNTKAILRDPLTIFLVLGLIIFALAECQGYREGLKIDISTADINRLSEQWSMQMRRPPNTNELNALVEQLIKEEIYYQEAISQGLDIEDTIVRRRMVQKLTFLTEDVSVPEDPSIETLQSFYEDNLQRYQEPTSFSFSHRYFSLDKRDDAEADARSATKNAEFRDDPFMLQKEYVRKSQQEVGDLFGRDFASQLSRLPVSELWQGPLQSAYGWHPVLISQVRQSEVRPFKQVQNKVFGDWQQAERRKANERYYQELRAKYQVTLPQTPEQ